MTAMTDLTHRGHGRFPLFADCLHVGVLTFLASAPLVTAFAAITAACQVLDDRIQEDASVTTRGYGRAFLATVRSRAGVLLVPPALVAVLALDVVALASGVPGARLVTVPLACAGGCLLIVGLRAASTWRPELRWPDVIRAAAVAALRRPGESLLLLAAAASTALIAALAPPLAVVLPGFLAFAAVAVARRAAP
jgi:hypothetical protein